MPRTYVPTGRPVGRPRKTRGPSIVFGENAEALHKPGNRTVFSRSIAGELAILEPRDDDEVLFDEMVHGVAIGVGCFRTPSRGSGC